MYITNNYFVVFITIIFVYYKNCIWSTIIFSVVVPVYGRIRSVVFTTEKELCITPDCSGFCL